MADKKEKKDKSFGDKTGGWFLEKLGLRLVITGIMAFIAWYAQKHSVTIAQFNSAYASIPFVGILAALAFDYGLDTGKLYTKMLGRGKTPLSKFILALGSVIVFFIMFTWILVGTITLNLAVIQPEVLVAAGFVSIVVLMPNTGTSEWLLWLWIAETIVTQGSYVAILPAIGGGLI